MKQIEFLAEHSMHRKSHEDSKVQLQITIFPITCLIVIKGTNMKYLREYECYVNGNVIFPINFSFFFDKHNRPDMP